MKTLKAVMYIKCLASFYPTFICFKKKRRGTWKTWLWCL